MQVGIPLMVYVPSKSHPASSKADNLAWNFLAIGETQINHQEKEAHINCWRPPCVVRAMVENDKGATQSRAEDKCFEKTPSTKHSIEWPDRETKVSLLEVPWFS